MNYFLPFLLAISCLRKCNAAYDYGKPWGLRIVSPPEFANLTSSACFPFSVDSVQANEIPGVHRTRIIQLKSFGFPLAAPEVCGPNPTVKLAPNTSIHAYDVEDYCKPQGSHWAQTVEVERIGYRLGAQAVIWLLDRTSQKRKVAGVPYMVYSTAKGVPFISCNYIEPDKLPLGYINDMFFKNHTEIVLDFQVVPSRWEYTFTHPAYIIWWRLVGMLYLYVAYYGLSGAYELRGSASLNSYLMSIEGTAASLCGVHLLLGGLFSSAWYPSLLHFGMLVMLNGSSFGTTLLAGLIFYDIRKQSQKLKVRNGKKVYAKFIKIIVGVAAFFVLLDLVTFVTMALYLKNVEVIITYMNVFLGLCTACLFIVQTTKFLTMVQKSFANSTASASFARLRRIAKLLFFSAIAMLVNLVTMALIGLSGDFYPGVHAPFGWTIMWSVYVLARLLVGYLQIMISRRKNKKKKVGKDGGAVTAKNSSTAGSKGSSAVSSSVSSSVGSSVSSSVGSSNATSKSSSTVSSSAMSSTGTSSPAISGRVLTSESRSKPASSNSSSDD